MVIFDHSMVVFHLLRKPWDKMREFFQQGLTLSIIAKREVEGIAAMEHRCYFFSELLACSSQLDAEEARQKVLLIIVNLPRSIFSHTRVVCDVPSEV